MTQEQIAQICGDFLPSAGNLPAGEPSLSVGFWVVPFSRKGFVLQAFLRDRPASSESELGEAKRELEKQIGLAIVSSDSN